MDLTSAAIATLISASTSAIVSFSIVKFNTKRDLDNQLDSILKIAIQYPYLESDEYTKSWNSKAKADDNFLRYDLYCTLIFNFLSRLCAFYKHNQAKIESHINMKSWVRQHARYWRDPTTAYENVDTYDRPFVQLVEDYLKGANI